MAKLLRTLLLFLSMTFPALPLWAQHTVFFSDFRQLGRLDSPAAVGPLEPAHSVMTASPASGLALLPSGELLQVGGEVSRVDRQSLELTEIVDIDIFCSDVTADGEGNIWCVHSSGLHCLTAETYELALSVEHPGLEFRGIASLGPRLFALAHLVDDYAAGPHLVEISPGTGGASILGPISLPTSPDEGRFFDIKGMDFDDAGDLWLGLPLYYPSVILPPPPDGYIARVLDPLGAAIVRPPQAVLGTSTPTPVILGAPSVVAVPAVGAAGLATLIGLLVICALAMLGKRA